MLGGIDLVRALALGGIRSVAVAPRSSPAWWSRHVAGRVRWSDPWTDDGALVDRLERFARAQPEPPVLYYEEDRDLLLVSRNRERLARCFRFLLPEAELVEQLADKGRFRVLAERLSLPVPPSRIVRPAEEQPPADLVFPLVLKPLDRSRFDLWRPIAHAAKALRVEDESALRAVWPALAAAGLELVAQEEVPGDETRIESYHAYVDAGGAIVADFTGRKIRTIPPAYGFSTALELTDASDTIELGRTLTARLGIRGVVKLDLKRRPDGSLALLEANPRFNLWHHLGAVGGVNLPALVHADLTGKPRPTTGLRRSGARWCDPLPDLRSALGQHVPLARWLAFAAHCDARSGLALEDPLPFLGGVAGRVEARLRG